MTENLEKQIVDLYLELGTYAKVKDVLGCSWDNICEATKKAGINKGLGGNHPNMIPDDDFIRYANEGKTVKEIASCLGVYNGTVANRLRKLNIEPVFVDQKSIHEISCKKTE